MTVPSELCEEQEGTSSLKKWILESKEREEEGKMGGDWKRGWILTRGLYVTFLFQGEKEKGKWQNFSKKAFGKKGFVKKSIFKTPEQAAGKASSSKSTFLFAHYFPFSGGSGHDGYRRKRDDRVQRRTQVQKGPMIPVIRVGWGSGTNLCCIFVSWSKIRTLNLVTISLINHKTLSVWSVESDNDIDCVFEGRKLSEITSKNARRWYDGGWGEGWGGEWGSGGRGCGRPALHWSWSVLYNGPLKWNWPEHG